MSQYVSSQSEASGFSIFTFLGDKDLFFIKNYDDFPFNYLLLPTVKLKLSQYTAIKIPGLPSKAVCKVLVR